jgi:Sulfatase-modifying factor enzyme 1/Caspase domain
MNTFLSAFFASLAVLALSGCDRVTNKGTGGGAQNPRGNSAPGSVLGNGVRTALIIGNGKYKKLPLLDACPRDAEQMAAAFQKIGVRIHGGKPLVNLTGNEMDAALNEFAGSLNRGSEAYIYYSGHGTQMGGGNYLLPVDFDPQFESQARRQAISLDSILALLEGTPSSLRVVILDACRDPGNFLPGEPALKGLQGKGLAEQRVDAPETLVCFATKHGTPALADDTSSFYTRALAEEIVKPGRVEDVLKAVARRVYADTEKRQLPFTYGSLLQDHYFAEPVPVNVAMPGNPAPSTSGVSSALFFNSLGMKFVPVEGTKVLFSVWDTRAQDYGVFARETGREWFTATFRQELTHPQVEVSWEDAQAFCAWLSKKEGRTYRLPTDAEWSIAVGLGEERGATPHERWDNDDRAPQPKLYPWGTVWPPPPGAGNYPDETSKKAMGGGRIIDGYDDGYAYTSPVGSFAPNKYGLYDMGGNISQWCEDWYDEDKKLRVLRGASWLADDAIDEADFRSAARLYDEPSTRNERYGFRCVLVISGDNRRP